MFNLLTILGMETKYSLTGWQRGEDIYFFSTFSDGSFKKGNEYIKIKGTQIASNLRLGGKAG